MVELVDTMDLKSIRPNGRCRFDSCMGLIKNGELQLLPKDYNHRANMVVKSK